MSLWMARTSRPKDAPSPSLQQLDEAVRALLAEYGYEHVTVVVDATFGHRIDAKEVPAYEEAVLNGELVTPPAGAIGRGDAFVLQIADRAERRRVLQRLVPGVPRRLSVALRRGTFDRRQARGQRRLGLRLACAGAWSASRRSMRDARKTTKGAAIPRSTPLKSAARPARRHEGGRRPPRRRWRRTATEATATEKAAPAAGQGSEEGVTGGARCRLKSRSRHRRHARSAPSFAGTSRADQRPARVPDVRRRSSDRFGRRRNRRSLLRRTARTCTSATRSAMSRCASSGIHHRAVRGRY